LKQVSELKAKLAEVKKSTRKDVTALQAKLTKVVFVASCIIYLYTDSSHC